MNILVLSWRGPNHPNAGGAEQVMQEHMKGWVAVGHKVTLFSSRFSGSLVKENIDGVEAIHRGDQYIGVKLAAFIYYLKNNDRFDLVVDQFHGIPFFTPLYVRKPKLAVLQEVAREVWFLSGFPWPFNWIIGIVGFITEPLIFFLYKKTPFLVGSQSAKNDLLKMGIPEANINIISHGVIIPRSKIVGHRSKIKTVVFLGALTKDKGIEDALKVFSILETLGNYNFWVIGKGSGEYKKHLDTLAKKLGLKDRVTFWGFVDESKKFELLTRAHILINPSIREGWGLVNIEANSVGTPVVAYRSPGLVDSVKDGISGTICTENTARNMADQIEKIIGNKEKYISLQKGAISWSKKFSWNISKELSSRLIDKITINSKKIQQQSVFHNYSSFNPMVLGTKGRLKIAKQISTVLKLYLKGKNLKSLSLLDVGCSSGIISNYLAGIFGEVTAIDVDKKAMDYAKKNFKRENLKFLIRDGSKTSFPNLLFDVIVANQVYYCFKKPKNFFDEVYRLLKPGGVCFLGARNKYTFWDAQYELPFLAFLPKNLADFFVRISGRSERYDAEYRTFRQLIKMTSKFKVEKITSKVIHNHQKYGFTKFKKYSFILSFIPEPVWSWTEPVLPNFIWILKKP